MVVDSVCVDEQECYLHDRHMIYAEHSIYTTRNNDTQDYPQNIAFLSENWTRHNDSRR